MNIQVLSDQHLLNNYRSGDQSAISKLIERHKRRVRDYIYMMVKDNDVADDIFQETFIKVIRVIDEGRYTDNGKFLSWVLRIAHNQVIDHFRACKQNKQVNESESGYNVLGSLRFAEKTIEDELISSQIESDVRNLIVLTQPKGFVKKKNKMLPAIRARYLRYPAFVEAVADRHERYNETLEHISMLEQTGQAYVIRPPIPLEIGSMERDPAQLRRVYETGRAVAEIQVDKIAAFVTESKALNEA